jgi:hypothetical protein
LAGSSFNALNPPSC